MKKMIHAPSGHTLHVQSIERADLPTHLSDDVDAYSKFYVVRNWDEKGCVFFYLAKGHKEAPTQICGWYANTGSFWPSYGTSLEKAIAGLQRDGWMYA